MMKSARNGYLSPKRNQIGSFIGHLSLAILIATGQLGSGSEVSGSQVSGAEINGPQEVDRNYTVLRDQVYDRGGSGEPLLADLYIPKAEGPFPGVLLIHGGAWMSGNKDQLAFIAHSLAARGFSVMAINYRLAPKHKFPAQIDDCNKALDWMREHAKEHKIDTDRLTAWGYSAGAHLALMLGLDSHDKIFAIVAGGSPVDFRDMPETSPYLSYWLGGTRAELPEVYEKASPATHIRPDTPPVFFYHGARDKWVPIKPVRSFITELKKNGGQVELFEFADSGHIFTLGAKKPAIAALNWLRQLFEMPTPNK
jgi:acetyl esterase/lipase